MRRRPTESPLKADKHAGLVKNEINLEERKRMKIYACPRLGFLVTGIHDTASLLLETSGGEIEIKNSLLPIIMAEHLMRGSHLRIHLNMRQIPEITMLFYYYVNDKSLFAEQAKGVRDLIADKKNILVRCMIDSSVSIIALSYRKHNRSIIIPIGRRIKNRIRDSVLEGFALEQLYKVKKYNHDLSSYLPADIAGIVCSFLDERFCDDFAEDAIEHIDILKMNFVEGK